MSYRQELAREATGRMKIIEGCMTQLVKEIKKCGWEGENCELDLLDLRVELLQAIIDTYTKKGIKFSSPVTTYKKQVEKKLKKYLVNE